MEGMCVEDCLKREKKKIKKSCILFARERGKVGRFKKIYIYVCVRERERERERF